MRDSLIAWKWGENGTQKKGFYLNYRGNGEETLKKMEISNQETEIGLKETAEKYS